MKQPGPVQRGYSLIEMLVVLAIVAILSIAGITYLGNRPSASVRGVMDELEGALLDVQKQAIASGRDMTMATQGTWNAADPMVLVRGDSTIGAGDWAAVLTAARGTWPPAQGGMTPAQYSSLAPEFHLATSGGALAREHLYAGVAPDRAAWDFATGTSEAITAVAPFLGVAGFTGTLVDGNRLFTGAANTGLSISGTNKRFNQTLWIGVVSMRGGNAMPGGPMGLLFVQANGGTVYKFYNPGSQSGDGKWRRI